MLSSLLKRSNELQRLVRLAEILVAAADFPAARHSAPAMALVSISGSAAGCRPKQWSKSCQQSRCRSIVCSIDGLSCSVHSRQLAGIFLRQHAASPARGSRCALWLWQPPCSSSSASRRSLSTHAAAKKRQGAAAAHSADAAEVEDDESEVPNDEGTPRLYLMLLPSMRPH